MKIKKRRRIKRNGIKPNTWIYAEDVKEWIKLPCIGGKRRITFMF